MALITARLAEKEYGLDVTDADGHTMRIDIPVDKEETELVSGPCKCCFRHFVVAAPLM